MTFTEEEQETMDSHRCQCSLCAKAELYGQPNPRIDELEARQCEKCEASIEEHSELTFKIAERDRQIAELEARLAEATGAFKNWHLTATTAWKTNMILEKQLASANARIAELEARLKKAEEREAKMRAILEGAGYDDLDDLDDTLTRDIEDCRRVGETVGDITQNHIEYAERAEADAGRLRTVSQNLIDAVARARKADDAVSRNSGLTADWDEHEDAHASLIICENAAKAALRPAEAGEEAK